MAFRPVGVIAQIQQDFREFGPLVTSFIFERNAQDGTVDQVYAALQAESDKLFRLLNAHMGPETVYRVLGDILGCIIQDISLVRLVQAAYPPYEQLRGALDSSYLKGMVYSAQTNPLPHQPQGRSNPQSGYHSPFPPSHYPHYQPWKQPHSVPQVPHGGPQPLRGGPHLPHGILQPPFPSVFGPLPTVPPPPTPPPVAPSPVAAGPTCVVTRTIARTVTHAPRSIDEEVAAALVTPETEVAPASTVCPLQTFLDEHGLGHLLEDLLEAHVTLPELKSLSPERFHNRLRAVVCSQGTRSKLLQALHPDGQLPTDAQPVATRNDLMNFLEVNAINLRSAEDSAEKARSQTNRIKSLLKIPHAVDVEPSAEPPHERVVCRFYGRGTCVRGESCKFAHVDSHTDRQPEERRGRGGGGPDARSRRNLRREKDEPMSSAPKPNAPVPDSSRTDQQAEAPRRRRGR